MSKINPPEEAYSKILNHIESENRLRRIPGPPREKNIDMLSNDYLGLAAESEKYMEEFRQRFPDAGFSSSASRLLSRSNKYHNLLEHKLEKLYGHPALLLNSGYHANVGIIQALAIPGTLFLADKLVHASAIDGLRLSGADYKRFPHNDIGKLKKLLELNHDLYERIVIIVESVYSMDGDFAPLKDIVKLKKHYPKMLLFVDEAHGFGTLGERGLGLSEQLGLIKDIDIIIGTLGKAAASAGSFAITSPLMKSYLVNSCRSFIFSTAISPAQAAWSLLMVEKMVDMAGRREHLRELSMELIGQLDRRLNIETISRSHIVPIIVGDAIEALKMAEYLRDHGFDCMAIRKPTVATGSERLRISLNASLTIKDITRLVSTLKQYRG